MKISADLPESLRRESTRAEPFGQGRVQVGEGLVGQDHLGPGRQRPGQGHPLLLAGGEFMGHPILQAGQSHHFQHLRHPVGTPGPSSPNATLRATVRWGNNA